MTPGRGVNQEGFHSRQPHCSTGIFQSATPLKASRAARNHLSGGDSWAGQTGRRFVDDVVDASTCRDQAAQVRVATRGTEPKRDRRSTDSALVARPAGHLPRGCHRHRAGGGSIRQSRPARVSSPYTSCH